MALNPVLGRPALWNVQGFYKVQLAFSLAGGQTALNTLWYATAFDFNPFDETLAADMANAIYTLWKKDVAEDALCEAISTGCRLETISVAGLDDNFDLATPYPHVKTVGESGIATGACLPPPSYVCARFNYLSETFVGVVNAPRRTYIAWPTPRESDVDETGKLTTNASDFYSTKLNLLAQVVTTAALEGMQPIRVSTSQNPSSPFGLILNGYARVSSCEPAPVVRWRRSRVSQETQF